MPSSFPRCLSLALLMGASVCAWAQTVSAPTWVVAQCAAQDSGVFIEQVAREAAAWTDRTGFEVCGVLAEDAQGRMSMTLSTNYSQIQCLVVPTLMAPNTHRIDQFHTHPTPDVNGRVVLHPYTQQLAQELGDTRFDGHTHIQLDNPSGFSKQDLATGGGYLATAGRLLHAASGSAQDLRPQPGPTVCQFSR